MKMIELLSMTTTFSDHIYSKGKEGKVKEWRRGNKCIKLTSGAPDVL